jgi:hypothetical protein
VAQVPLFQVAAPMIKRIGMANALLACQLAAALRLLGYVSVPSAWYVLPFEVRRARHPLHQRGAATLDALLG